MAPPKNQNKDKKCKPATPPAKPTVPSVKPTAPPADRSSPTTQKCVPSIEQTAPPADASSSTPNPPAPTQTQESSSATPPTENASAPCPKTPASSSASPPTDAPSPPSHSPDQGPSPVSEQPTAATLPEDISNALPLPLDSSSGVGERKKKNNGAAKKARRKAKEESRLVDKIKAEREALDDIIKKMQKLRAEIYEQDGREQEHHVLLTKKMDEQAATAKEAAEKQGLDSLETLEEQNKLEEQTKLLIQQKIAELSRKGASHGSTPTPEGTEVPGAGRKRTKQVAEGQIQVKNEWLVHEGPTLPPGLLKAEVSAPPLLGPGVPPDMEANYEKEKKEKQRKELEQEDQQNKETQKIDIDQADKPNQAPGPNRNATSGGGRAATTGLLGIGNKGLFPGKTRQPENDDSHDQFPDHPVHMDKLLLPKASDDDEESENEAVKATRKAIKGKAKASPF